MARSARKLNQTVFEKRCACLSYARRDLSKRHAAALAALHEEDRANAESSAYVNAADTVIESGNKNISQNSFKFLKAFIQTLEMLADCAEDYGYRRA